jgi:hypothetical protein
VENDDDIAPFIRLLLVGPWAMGLAMLFQSISIR